MEKLIIHNFLTIRSAEIDVRRFNIFIGPQASGKSIIVKLLYFFKAEFSKVIKEVARKKQGINDMENYLKSQFERIFPRTYWNTQIFDISYSYDEFTLSINTKTSNHHEIDWSIFFSEKIHLFLDDINKKYEQTLREGEKKGKLISLSTFGNSYEYFDEFYDEYIRKYDYSKYFKIQVFIPANRTFFVSLQKNIFSILNKGIGIDFFLVNFGSTFEQAKHFLATDIFLDKDFNDLVIPIMRRIISGEYLDEGGEDWIVNTTGKINLMHASSGQQESLPMLLVLCILPKVIERIKAGFFIEEPEAHLYPDAQNDIISLLALILNKTNHQFFITTHSPYLLTALNNCILAHETYEAADEAGKQKVLTIMPEHQHIAFEDVAAWTVTEKGTIKSILDQEAKIIGASILDGVSQHFETVTNELLDILYGDQS